MTPIKLLNGLKLVERPGYFGRRRDEKIAALDKRYGKGKWQLYWYTPKLFDFYVDAGVDPYNSIALCDFNRACITHYGASYLAFMHDNPTLVEEVCTYGECYDNAITNISSERDYTIQEAFSTHIQDIAVRNVLHIMGRKFEGPKDKLLQIRSSDSNGFRLNPGQVPYIKADNIVQPSKAPSWALPGSVEDFWQSNKFIGVME